MRKHHPPGNANDMELLVSNGRRSNKNNTFGKISGRVKWYLFLLFIGLVGVALCLWAVLFTAHSEDVIHGLGMTRVANSLENILDLLALPALMFAVILCAYASQRLYSLYRKSNDPHAYRRK